MPSAITVEVIHNSLVRACEEMRVTVERTAYSSVIAESVDFSCGLIDTNKQLLAEASGIPVFLANLSLVTEEVDRIIGFQNLEAEDIIFCNDPYSGGYSHCCDVTVVYPIFFRSELLGFAGFKGHVLDMGGIHPGGWYNNTTECFQEGIAFPPVKLYRRGQPNTDVIRILERNTRLPESVMGDIRAMVSAVRVGGQHVCRLAEKYGRDQFLAAIRQTLDNNERISREAVAEIPDGVYEGEFFLDGDGDDGSPISDRLVTKMKITVQGDCMEVDLTGSSPCSPGPMNCPRESTISMARYGFKCLVAPFVSNNDGLFRNLKVHLPDNTILSAKFPHATTLTWAPSTGFPDLMVKCLQKALPERAVAGHFGDVCVDFVYGAEPRPGRGSSYIVAEPTAGGWGATPTRDGETMFCMADGDTYNVPVEVFEARFPLRFVRYALREGSGGAGKFRGGLGVYKEYQPLGHEARVTATFERSKYSPGWGIHGGHAGVPNRMIVIRRDGSQQECHKITNFALEDGAIISFQTGGGGGYGDPLERNPDAVRRDVIEGYIPLEAAQRDYGVVLESKDALTVDFAETARSRQNQRVKG